MLTLDTTDNRWWVGSTLKTAKVWPATLDLCWRPWALTTDLICPLYLFISLSNLLVTPCSPRTWSAGDAGLPYSQSLSNMIRSGQISGNHQLIMFLTSSCRYGWLQSGWKTESSIRPWGSLWDGCAWTRSPQRWPHIWPHRKHNMAPQPKSIFASHSLFVKIVVTSVLWPWTRDFLQCRKICETQEKISKYLRTQMKIWDNAQHLLKLEKKCNRKEIYNPVALCYCQALYKGSFIRHWGRYQVSND